MENFELYQRKGLSEMTPYFEGMDITGVSISEADTKACLLYTSDAADE